MKLLMKEMINGEEFVIRRKIDGRKYDENDRTTYNIYHVKVNDCKISRQCDFDINRFGRRSDSSMAAS